MKLRIEQYMMLAGIPLFLYGITGMFSGLRDMVDGIVKVYNADPNTIQGKVDFAVGRDLYANGLDRYEFRKWFFTGGAGLIATGALFSIFNKARSRQTPKN